MELQSNGAGSNDVLAQSVRDAKAAIQAATRKKWDAHQVADNAWFEAKRPHEHILDEVKRKYEGTATELTKGRAPVNRHGAPLDPDDVSVSEDGIELRWDGNHPYDIVDITVTWAELTGQVCS